MFLDESGDPGIRGSNYLIIASLLVEDTQPLRKIIKNMRRNKFKKELKKANEIKANSSSDAVIKHMITALNNVVGAKLHCVVFEKRTNKRLFHQKDLNSLYNYIAGALAKQIKIQDNIIIRIDRSKGKQTLRQEFDNYFLDNLNEGSELGNVEIYHSNSNSWEGLQFVDIIAWSYFQSFEHRNHSYVDLIDMDCKLFEL
ncbi:MULTISPECIES: DUF3800 domain-containing protein [Methanobacterium]|jgi:hypothetical protein|uniref:DUF3800 domain-containing protein n=1 Tax=Methanobacterium formicicum TaxID=2162 RepID=A0A090I141_METFO|nr:MULTISPECIES: DUF3800 domain-containing protein [Methanobacterium]AIS32776.1 hypothetical protein BRM9_1972 [Methanobacterium formicicum]MDH2660030.1 DUF3800 domain-containing protein [Methanobacterium formicicum]CEA12529.1 hypothetical protein DSM1535_0164 [Methanobacterium formicicum]CEL24032.1 hypothetical protein MB9_0384 [Methanobacterium formicicum]